MIQIPIYQGLSDEYRQYIETQFGDAAPQYIAMLEKLSQTVSSVTTPDAAQKIFGEITDIVDEIKKYVGQFGFMFSAAILIDKNGKCFFRTDLTDLTLGQMMQ